MTKPVHEARPLVTLFMPSLRGGGAERVLVDLASGIASRGFPVDVVVLNTEGAIHTDLGEGVNLVDLQRTRAAVALPALVSYLRRRRPSVLLSTLEHTNVLAVIATKLVGGIRVVLREANTLSEDLASEGLKGRGVRFAMRSAYRAADRLIAVSEGVAEGLVQVLGLAPEKISVIASPVITERLREGAQGPVDHPWLKGHGTPVIIGVGRLSQQKGFDVLIRAFAKLREKRPCRLVIFGEGPLRAELAGLANRLGVAEYVDLPGFTDKPFSHMAAADLFVLSSRWEGLPNVLIQAMAVGAKVVSTDCPSGPSEVLDDGDLGELVPVEDEEALAAAMERTLARPRRELPEEWYSRYEAEEVIERYAQALDLPGV